MTAQGGKNLFGTDGIRARSGEGYLELEEVARILAATAWVLGEKGRFPADFPQARAGASIKKVLIGRDTRESGVELEEVMVRSLTRAGHDVASLGVIPTPGVAHLAASDETVTLGIMISASHNPAEYNGIKFLAPTGSKVSSDFENAVSEAYWAGKSREATKTGTMEEASGAVESYQRFLSSCCRHGERFASRKLVLDMANGATVPVAPGVFEALGATIIAVGDQPDGKNINENCGALFPDRLAARVRAEGADLGFAFDGDGDRMIPVTRAGRVLDGDHVLAIAGRYFDRDGRLPLKTVVTTVMANIGLEKSLAAAGLQMLRTAVGDRYVHQAMVRDGHPIGGEQSGHLIFLDDIQTGDGILAALRLVDCLDGVDGEDLDAASEIMTKYPQILLNYRVAEKRPLEDFEAIQQGLTRAEETLGADGRVVLRYSGTEPLVRVMVEGPEEGLIRSLAEDLGETIVSAISAKG